MLLLLLLLLLPLLLPLLLLLLLLYPLLLAMTKRLVVCLLHAAAGDANSEVYFVDILQATHNVQLGGRP
jgi:hypothetical protein